jgi:hypothetical protein
VRGEHDLHPEGARQIGHALPQYAFADDAQLLTEKIADRVIEEAELPGVLPAPGDDILAIGDDIALQRKDQRHYLFGDGIDRIAADVRNGDAMVAVIGLVDAIRAGGGDGNQLERGELRQRRGGERHLVVDDDGGVSGAVDNLIGTRLAESDHFMGKTRRSEANLVRDCIAIE